MGRKFEFDFVPFTFEQIREMSDDDLYKSISSFRRKIKEASKAGKDTQPYEVEFCYLEHERIMRDRSREAHSKFVRNNPRNQTRSSRPKRNFVKSRENNTSL